MKYVVSTEALLRLEGDLIVPAHDKLPYMIELDGNKIFLPTESKNCNFVWRYIPDREVPTFSSMKPVIDKMESEKRF